MMSRQIMFGGAVVVAALLLGSALIGQRLHRAEAAVERAEVTLAQAHEEARMVRHLRARDQRLETGARPANDLIGRIRAALDAAGLEGQNFDVSAESDGPIGNAGAGRRSTHHRQSHLVKLSGLAPEACGQFLLAWRERESVWTPTRVEMTHHRPRNRRNAGAENRYDLAVVLTAIYVAE